MSTGVHDRFLDDQYHRLLECCRLTHGYFHRRANPGFYLKHPDPCLLHVGYEFVEGPDARCTRSQMSNLLVNTGEDFFHCRHNLGTRTWIVILRVDELTNLHRGKRKSPLNRTVQDTRQPIPQLLSRGIAQHHGILERGCGICELSLGASALDQNVVEHPYANEGEQALTNQRQMRHPQ